MADENLEPPFTVFADNRITRRKYYHIITDGADSVIFRSRLWGEVVEFLDTIEVHDYRLKTDEGDWQVTHRRLIDQTE